MRDRSLKKKIFEGKKETREGEILRCTKVLGEIIRTYYCKFMGSLC